MSEISARPTLTVCDHLSLAMILLRHGMAEAASRALQQQCGIELPSPGRLSAGQDMLLLWSGPDRFLAVREHPGSPAAELSAVLHELAFVVEASSSRTVLQLTGHAAVDMLNRLLPIDLHPRVFTPGSVALTTAGHIAVQLWRCASDSGFHVACSTSFGGSLRNQLAQAGFGSEALSVNPRRLQCAGASDVV